jgi:hypothetical protein
VGGKRATLIRRFPDLARSSFWGEEYENEKYKESKTQFHINRLLATLSSYFQERQN